MLIYLGKKTIVEQWMEKLKYLVEKLFLGKVNFFLLLILHICTIVGIMVSTVLECPGISAMS